MKKVMVQRLDVEQPGSRMMALQIRDDEKLADGSRWQEEIIQAEQEGDRVRLLFDNQRAKEREWITISLADWQRLHAAPHWRHVSWSPFIAYERETLRGKAVLTHRDDPQKRMRGDHLTHEFWQARLHLQEGILATFHEFACLAGREEAFCEASEWTVQAEQGKREPTLTIASLVEGQTDAFKLTRGFPHAASVWQARQKKDIARFLTSFAGQHGHSTILVRDFSTLKALLPETKVAAEHSPTGMPIH